MLVTKHEVIMLNEFCKLHGKKPTTKPKEFK
jgi:hypothetical protein